MKSRIMPVSLTILVIVIIYLFSRLVDPVALELWVAQAGVFGPLLIIFLAIVMGILAPLSGTPVNLAGFILYGPSTVFLFAVSGVVSAAINFYIARRWGRPLIKRFVGEKDMQKVDEFTKEHGIVSLFVMRIFLGSVHDFLSYAMGLTAMKPKPYMITSTLGILVGTVVWYVIALQTKTPLAFLVATLLSGTAFMGVYGLYKLAQKIAKTKVTP